MDRRTAWRPRLGWCAVSLIAIALLVGLAASVVSVAAPPDDERGAFVDRLAPQLVARLPTDGYEVEISSTTPEESGDVAELVQRLGRAGYRARVTPTTENRRRYGNELLSSSDPRHRIVIVGDDAIERAEASPLLRELAVATSSPRNVRARALRQMTEYRLSDATAQSAHHDEVQALARTLAGRAVFLALLGDPAPAHIRSNGLPAAPRPKTALLYGDGLVFEAQTALRRRFDLTPGWQLRVHAFGLTAPCDWVEWLPADLERYHPAVVGILTAGDAATDCMREAGHGVPVGSPEYFSRYRSSLDALFRASTASGARVIFFSAPPFADAARAATVARIDDIATEIARHYPYGEVSDVVNVTLSRRGRFSSTLPCLPTETAKVGCGRHHRILVRSPRTSADHGLHLCPVGLRPGSFGRCAVYSSGEFRFARAVTDAVVNAARQRTRDRAAA